jgi:hypothetical protein
MPCQPTVTKSRLNNIVVCLAPTLALLKELNDAFGPPFVQPITNTIETLISMTRVRSFKPEPGQSHLLQDGIECEME